MFKRRNTMIAAKKGYLIIDECDYVLGAYDHIESLEQDLNDYGHQEIETITIVKYEKLSIKGGKYQVIDSSAKSTIKNTKKK